MKHAILGALLALAVNPAFGQFTKDQCSALAEFSVQVAQTRDLGASVEKHVKAVRTVNSELPPQILDALERVVRAVYASKADGKVVAFAIYRWCLSGGDGAPV